MASASSPPTLLDKPTPVDCSSLPLGCSPDSTGFTIAESIFNIIGIAVYVAGTIFVAALVYGAIMYVISTGDEAKAQRAKLIAIYALVGLLIVAVAGIVVNVVINTFSYTIPAN